MTWQKCPDCGRNINGESAFYVHVEEQHPILAATSHLAARRTALAGAELQLARWLDYTTALDGDLPVHVRALVENRVLAERRNCWPDGRPETDGEVVARLRATISYYQEAVTADAAEVERLKATDGS